TDRGLVFRSSSLRKLGSSFCLWRASTPPAEERVTFFACAKKVTKETHPGRRALRASCPAGARAATGFAQRTPVCAQRTGAHPARHPSDFSSARSPRLTGPRFGRHPAAEAKAEVQETRPKIRSPVVAFQSGAIPAGQAVTITRPFDRLRR